MFKKLLIALFSMTSLIPVQAGESSSVEKYQVIYLLTLEDECGYKVNTDLYVAHAKKNNMEGYIIPLMYPLIKEAFVDQFKSRAPIKEGCSALRVWFGRKGTVAPGIIKE